MGTTFNRKIKVLNQLLGFGSGFFIVNEKTRIYIGTIERLTIKGELLIMQTKKCFSFFGGSWVHFNTKEHWECACGNTWGYSLNNNCGDSFFSNLKNTGIPIATMQIYSVGSILLYKDKTDFLRQLDFLCSIRYGINKGFPKLPEL